MKALFGPRAKAERGLATNWAQTDVDLGVWSTSPCAAVSDIAIFVYFV
ncbi:MAG: hypothetical protein WAN46_13520 [Gammaproteobacteria bacterium]|jgi:hypothetical protein